MNRNRKNRLNLSLVRKSESPKSPVQDRSSVTEVTSECNTPLNSRKRSSTISDGSPVLNDYDSPILMSQDTSNLVTGVSWAWNSPKRTIPEECRPKPRPLLASNNILPPKEPDLRKQTTERLVGFYKFQMELKKIQLEAQQNADNDCQQKVEVKPPSPKSPNGSDLFDSFGETDTNGDPPTTVVFPDETPVNPPYLAQMDSFNDSAFDSLLLQASQAAEKKSENVLDTATTSNEGSVSTPKRKSFFKSRTINDLDSIAVNDLLNDSTDFCLIEASQMVEGNLNNFDNKTTAEQSSSKKTNSLTRHKSLPASPSQKVPTTKNPEAPSLRSNFDANFINSDSSSRAEISHGLTCSSPQPVRLCTKEEIEQKRQEALKRQQARRLNRLGGLGNTVLNNNHLANAARKS